MQRCIFTSAVQNIITLLCKKIKIKSYCTTLSTEQKIVLVLCTTKILFSTKKSVKNCGVHSTFVTH